MKKILFLMLAAMFVTASCNGLSGKKKDGKEDSKTVNAIHLTKADFLKKAFDFESDTEELKYLGDKPAVIDFYADWCGPCRSIAPLLEELGGEYKDKIYVYKVDVDKEPEISAAFNIESLPTLLFVPMDGRPQISIGSMSKADLREAIESVLLGNSGADKK